MFCVSIWVRYLIYMLTNKLSVQKKSKNKYVIQDFNQNRKQITCKDGSKKWSSRTAAELALKALIADVATNKVVISNRHKFKEEYLKYASTKLESANTEGVRLSAASVKGYVSNYNLYIEDCFPDIYIDEVTGPVLRDFVKKVYQLKHNSFTGNSIWFKVKDLIYKIKTFLRYAAGEDMAVNLNVFNWHMKDQYELHPEDDTLFYPKKTTIIQAAQANKLIEGLYSNKNRSYIDLLKLTAIATFTFTGLRYAELKGIQKADVDLVNQTIYIGGVYDHSEGRYKKKTKKQSSTRTIDIQDDYLPFITEWMKQIKNLDNPYLFPSLRTKGPVSTHAFRSMIWKVYEEYGMATLNWKISDTNNVDGKRNSGSRGITKSFTIVESPFKGAPTKTFRHSLATHLVNAVKSDPLIDQNYVANVFGHGDYVGVTEAVYGNHIHEISSEQRAARRIAVKKAMANVVSFPKKYVS